MSSFNFRDDNMGETRLNPEVRLYNRYGYRLEWDLVSDNQLVLKVHGALYYRVIGSRSNPLAVDPDGGPYLEVGQLIHLQETFKITKILNVDIFRNEDDPDNVVITFGIERVVN
ncbi:hypothetical protein HK102_004782 [Quaeritorhiza haematococci]|nr:hypothetical protein HK102_004782 [Quaeritorhiza haematococci]